MTLALLLIEINSNGEILTHTMWISGPLFLSFLQGHIESLIIIYGQKTFTNSVATEKNPGEFLNRCI